MCKKRSHAAPPQDQPRMGPPPKTEVLTGTCPKCLLLVGDAFTCVQNDWETDDGRRLPPIPWGGETKRWAGYAAEYGACPGCGVQGGGYHHAGCPVEQVPDGVNAPIEPTVPETPAPSFSDVVATFAYSVGYIAGRFVGDRIAILLAIVAVLLAARACGGWR